MPDEQKGHSIADDVAFLREMIRSSRPRSGSEEAHDAWDDAIDRAYATLDRLVEQLEAVRTWFRTEPWKGHPDGSSFGCGDYTQAERAMGYGSYRDPRFLPAFLREASTPACVCGEINTRHCPVHAGGSSPAKKRPCRPESQSTHCRYCGAAPMYQRDDCPASEPKEGE